MGRSLRDLYTFFFLGWVRWASRWSASVFEAVAELSEDFARVVEVEAAEGEAVVEQDSAVGYIGCGDGGG